MFLFLTSLIPGEPHFRHSQPLEMGLEFNLNARFNLTEISGPGPSLQSHGKVGHETLRQPDVNRKLRKSPLTGLGPTGLRPGRKQEAATADWAREAQDISR